MYQITLAQETNRGNIQTIRAELGKIPSIDVHEDKSDDSGIFDRRINRRSVLKGAAAVATYPGMLLTAEEEASPGLNRFGTTGLLIDSMKNWASGVAFWNLALDEAGGPKIGAGCNNCTGLITVAKDGYKLTDDYYELGNFSKYIKPGAERIQAVTKGQLESLAFHNPDGSYVLIIVIYFAYTF